MAYKEMKLNPGEAIGLSQLWNSGMDGKKAKPAGKKQEPAKKPATPKKGKK